AEGKPIGRSLAEPDKRAEARTIAGQLQSARKELLLPLDVVVAPSPDAAGAGAAKVYGVAGVPDDVAIVDVGPRTVDRYAAEIGRAKTVVWNGAPGLAEAP